MADLNIKIQCSRLNGHTGTCKRDKKPAITENSPVYKKSKLSSAINLLEEEKCKTEDVVLALSSIEKGQRKTLNELEESNLMEI